MKKQLPTPKQRRHKRPSDIFKKDLTEGNLTQAVHFWCFRKAGEFIKMNVTERAIMSEYYHIEVKELIKNYMIMLYESKRLVKNVNTLIDHFEKTMEE